MVPHLGTWIVLLLGTMFLFDKQTRFVGILGCTASTLALFAYFQPAHHKFLIVGSRILGYLMGASMIFLLIRKKREAA